MVTSLNGSAVVVAVGCAVVLLLFELGRVCGGCRFDGSEEDVPSRRLVGGSGSVCEVTADMYPLEWLCESCSSAVTVVIGVGPGHGVDEILVSCTCDRFECCETDVTGVCGGRAP